MNPLTPIRMLRKGGPTRPSLGIVFLSLPVAVSFAVVALVVMTTVTARAQSTSPSPIWVPTMSEPAIARWSGLDCADSLHCMMSSLLGVGLENHFLVTEDGGRTWVVRNSDTGSSEGGPLHTGEIAYMIPELAVAVAAAGHLYRSTDQGVTWEIRRLDPSVPDHYALFVEAPPLISMSDARHGLVVTTTVEGVRAESHYYRTDDGAESWTSLPTVPIPPGWDGLNDYGINAVAAYSFGPGRYACVLATPGVLPQIATTEDGGNQWSYHLLPNDEAPWGLENGRLQGLQLHGAGGVDDRTAYLTGIHNISGRPAISSYVARTDDGGRSWRLIHHDIVEGEHAGIGDASFRDAQNGLAIAYGSILRTSDGGTTWRRDSAVTLVPSTTVTGRIEWLGTNRSIFAHRQGQLLVWEGSVSAVGVNDPVSDSLSCTVRSSTADGVELMLRMSAPSSVSLRLWSMSGAEQYAESAGRYEAGERIVTVALPGDLPAGFYFLQVSTDRGSVVLGLRNVPR